MRAILIAALGLGLAATGAQAQTAQAPTTSAAPPAQMTAPAAPATMSVKGVVVAADSKSLTVKTAEGKTVTMPFSPKCRILVLKTIDMSAIKPGSFIATTNVPLADGVGQSTEFRVFSPDLNGVGEGNYSMEDGTSNMMTNATVTTQVAATPKGREMDVKYGGKGGPGVRHIVVPDNVPVRSMASADVSALKPGLTVQVRAAATGEGGAMQIVRVSLDMDAQPK